MSKVGIVGAGTMGTGIAQTCILAGHSVILYDVYPGATDRARKNIEKALEKLVAKGKLSSHAAFAAAFTFLGNTDTLDGLKDCHIVIEAALENFEVKVKLFQELENVVDELCILASNTSSISLTQIAAATKHPERVVSMHFFNPVPVMALVEVIPALQTSENTINYVVELAKQLGKTPIIVKDSPGFAVNRILIPMINEAILLLEEGVATAEDIDTSMKLGANHPIGPLSLSDLIGNDVVLAVMEVLYNNFNDSKYRPAYLLKKMVYAGRLGRKTKVGFFTYN